MGRIYAGVLGLIAFATLVARGVVQQSGAAVVVPTAVAALFVFAGLGWVLGTLARQAIAGDLRSRFQEELVRVRREEDPSAGGGSPR